jgi:hypothetical protein
VSGVRPLLSRRQRRWIRTAGEGDFVGGGRERVASNLGVPGSVLKDYMQTGKFTRGDQDFSAQCAIVLGGNIETDLERPDGNGRGLSAAGR